MKEKDKKDPWSQSPLCIKDDEGLARHVHMRIQFSTTNVSSKGMVPPNFCFLILKSY